MNENENIFNSIESPGILFGFMVAGICYTNMTWRACSQRGWWVVMVTVAPVSVDSNATRIPHLSLSVFDSSSSFLCCTIVLAHLTASATIQLLYTPAHHGCSHRVANSLPTPQQHPPTHQMGDVKGVWKCQGGWETEGGRYIPPPLKPSCCRYIYIHIYISWSSVPTPPRSIWWTHRHWKWEGPFGHTYITLRWTVGLYVLKKSFVYYLFCPSTGALYNFNLRFHFI